MTYSHFVPHAAVRCVVALLVTASLVASAQAQSSNAKDTQNKSKFDIAKSLGEGYVESKPVDTDQTRFVIYRAFAGATDPGEKTGVVSVYLNDRYHASLQKDAYSVVCLNGTSTDIRTRFLADGGEKIQPELDTQQTVAIKGGQSIYLRVSDTDGNKTRIEQVRPQRAAADLASARQQKHTLSRVPGVQPCREASAKSLQEVPSQIALGAVAPFEIQQTKSSAITEQGQQELQQLAEKISKKYKSGEAQVHLIGYADEADDETVNAKTAQRRINSVQNSLKTLGMRGVTFTQEVLGKTDPYRSTARGLSPRRVDVDVLVVIQGQN